MSNIKEIKKKVDGQTWKDAIDKAFDKIQKEIRIDGFRKGKAPKDIIVKKYGEANIWLDAADLCIGDAYSLPFVRAHGIIIEYPSDSFIPTPISVKGSPGMPRSATSPIRTPVKSSL